jgi:hypothetical protein
MGKRHIMIEEGRAEHPEVPGWSVRRQAQRQKSGLLP